MGNTYHNIIVKGPTQNAIVAHLNRQGQNAFVSPTLNGLTFVYAPDEAWSAPAEGLSRAFNCPTLFAWAYDHDVFGYDLYDGGRHIDAYISSPEFLESEDREDPDEAEDNGDAETAGGMTERQPDLPGGDARLLCAAFGVGSAVERVDAILHPPAEESTPDGGSDAFEQHYALAGVMDWPPEACITDYQRLDKFGVDEELAAAFAGATFVKTPTSGGA